MVKNMLKYVDADIILWAHATNPFIDHLIYNNAIKSFKKSTKNFDSLFSVSILKIILWDNKKKPINHNPFSKKHIVASQLNQYFLKMEEYL